MSIKKIKRQLSSTRGFTLVELLVVLVIAGVLAALAVPAFTGYIDNMRQRRLADECESAALTAQMLYGQTYKSDTTPSEEEIRARANLTGVVSGVDATDTHLVMHLTYTEEGGNNYCVYCREPDSCDLHDTEFTVNGGAGYGVAGNPGRHNDNHTAPEPPQLPESKPNSEAQSQPTSKPESNPTSEPESEPESKPEPKDDEYGFEIDLPSGGKVKVVSIGDLELIEFDKIPGTHFNNESMTLDVNFVFYYRGSYYYLESEHTAVTKPIDIAVLVSQGRGGSIVQKINTNGPVKLSNDPSLVAGDLYYNEATGLMQIYCCHNRWPEHRWGDVEYTEID